MKRILLTLLFILTPTLLSGCAQIAPAPTATQPVPPTPTSPPPTETIAATHTAVPTETQLPTAEPTLAATETAGAGGISFASNVKPIINAKCVKCHGVEQVKEGLDLTTYGNMMAGSFNGPVVVPGNAGESLMVQLIERGKMPNRGPKIAPEELQLIRDWIDQGALDN